MKKFLIFFLVITLTACAAPQEDAPSPTPEATGTVPPKTATPALTATATEDPLYSSTVNQLQAQVDGNSYLQALQEVTGNDLVEACAEAALQTAQEGHVDFEIVLDPYGDCRIISDNGKQAIFPGVNDESGSSLYVTEEGGRTFLESLVAAGLLSAEEADTATIRFDNLLTSGYAEMVSASGEVLAVATRDSQSQWRQVKNGVIIGENGQAMIMPTPTADAGAAAAGEIAEVRVANEKIMAQFASEILAGTRKFPEDMSDALNWALIDELNKQIGPVPIYFEAVDKNGNPVVTYYNLKDRNMKQLRGNYLDHRDEINANSITIYQKLRVDPQTGLTSYVDPATSELVEIPNSKGVNWSWLGDKSVSDGYVQLPGNEVLAEATRRWVEDKKEEIKRTVVQFVLTGSQAATLRKCLKSYSAVSLWSISLIIAA